MKNTITLSILIFLFGSCQKRDFKVDNKDYKSKLVINNLFEQNLPFEIRVSHSVNIYDTVLPEYLSTATVRLYTNNQYTETLTPGIAGYYTAGTVPTPGNTYKITVSSPGFDSIEATNTIPKPVKIIDWSYIDSTYIDNKGDYFGDLSFTIIDPAEENSYLLSLQFYDSAVTHQYIYLSKFESGDQSLNQNLAKRLQNGEYLFTDNLFNGKQKTILLSVPSGYYQDHPDYLLKLYSLSKEAYYYYFSKPESGQQQNTAPIYSNVKNGLGIFAGRSLDVDTIR